MEEKETEVIEETTPDAEETTAEADTQTEEATAPAEATAEAEQEATEAAAPWDFSVRYNHESREMTREDATKYAQLGLLHEAQQPVIDKIRLMAAGRGQSLTEFIDAFAEADKQNQINEYLEQTGNNAELANRLYEADMAERRNKLKIADEDKAKAEKADEESLSNRLAAEFTELQAEFPELAEFKQVPESVVNDAVRNNRSLYDSYLRYDRKQQKLIKQNEQKQAATNKAALGTAATGGGTTDPDRADIIRDLWGR